LDEEIKLRELLETLINGKRLIIGILVISLALAGVLSFFILPVKYEASATIIFDSKFMDQQGLSIKSYDKLINDYSKLKTIYDNLQLAQKDYTIDSLQQSLETKVDEKSNQIEIVAAGNDPQTAQDVVNKLGEISVIDFKKRLVDDKNRQIKQLQKQLVGIEEDMEATPKLLGANDIRNQGGQVVQIPQVNPMYEKLSSRWDDINSNLSQLQFDKDYLEKGIETGGKGLYIIFNKASLPEKPVSPRKMLNMALAGALGLMVGVFVVFFREFWRKSAPESKGTVSDKV
jgi:capsular polysaccharide biosynthesis protein